MAVQHAIRYLLANNAALIAEVAADDIVAGPLPQATLPPAISITHVSTVTLNMVKEAASPFQTTRMQVSVMAENYGQLLDLLALVRAALPRAPGVVNGFALQGILLDVEGPHFMDGSTKCHYGSQDVIVTYSA